METVCLNPKETPGDGTLQGKTVVALSGGVDSSVAALLLKEQGHDVVGISMQVWDYRNHGGNSSRATCCAPDDFNDARRVAATIGVPYYVLDFESHFRKEVIDRFVDSYLSGITPNPCVDCNRKVKFNELRNRAIKFGCLAVATGHYARITKDNSGFHLLRGSDPDKDQSYFLYGLTQTELKSTLFPVGALTKPQVREIARQAGLVTAEKAESQDICFVSGSVKDFIKKARGDVGVRGVIENTDGEIVGEHEGLHTVTVGQRRGLSVGGSSSPLYVIQLDSSQNKVILGPKSALERESFSVQECTWVSPDTIRKISAGERKFSAMAQLRYRHKGVLVDIEVDGEDARVHFKSDWATVTPGQAAVFYDLKNEEVLGGARIAREDPA